MELERMTLALWIEYAMRSILGYLLASTKGCFMLA